MVVCQQRGHAQDVRLVELERGDELVRVGVDAEIHDLKPAPWRASSTRFLPMS
jgi:hypothetical protein